MDPHPTQEHAAPAWAGCLARPAQEFATTPLRLIEGRIPLGLRGTLYRNGPARLERGGIRVGHWFDGDGAVLAVRFADGGADATYRFVRSAGFRREEAAGRLLFGNYGMTAPGPVWNHWRRPLKNAANTSVLALDDRVLALWEGGGPHALDPVSLGTRGLDDLAGPGGRLEDPWQPFSAHPKRDPETGDIYNFGVRLGRAATLWLYRCDARGRLQAQSRVPLQGNPFIHDWVLAGPYLVVIVPPVRVDALGVLLGRKSYSEAMRWQPRLGTGIRVFDRHSLKPLARGETEPWFQWHFGNGHVDEQDGAIVLDFIRYPNFDTNRHLREVAEGRTRTPTRGTLNRLRLDPARARVLECAQLSDRSVEFPSVPSEWLGRPSPATHMVLHRAWTDTTAERYDGLARFDHERGLLEEADLGDARYPSEPIVALDARDGREWTITVIYDGQADASEVWVFDGGALPAGPVCRLALPRVIPLSFHGCWQPLAH